MDTTPLVGLFGGPSRVLTSFLGKFVVAADVGQPHVAALEQVGQLAVVQAEELEDRGVEVVDVHAVLDGAEAEFVGRADDLPALHASPASQVVKPYGL